LIWLGVGSHGNSSFVVAFAPSMLSKIDNVLASIFGSLAISVHPKVRIVS
jgi:aromatic ring-cleaving dioxygenase